VSGALDFTVAFSALELDSNAALARAVRMHSAGNAAKRALVAAAAVALAGVALWVFAAPAVVAFVVSAAVAAAAAALTRRWWPVWDPFTPCSAVVLRAAIGDAPGRPNLHLLDNHREQQFLARWLAAHPHEAPCALLGWSPLADEVARRIDALTVDLARSFAREHPGSVADVLTLAEVAQR
jgi:hypothetical protein